MFKKIVCTILLMVMTICVFNACGEINEDPKVPTFEGLSYETERQIRKAYYDLLCKDYAERGEYYGGKADDIQIREYYGTYNGYPVVTKGWGFGMTISYGFVDGVYFQSGSIFEISLFKDNRLIDFVDAYNDGFLTRENLRSIQAIHHKNRLLAVEFDIKEKTIWSGNIDEDFDDRTIIVTISKGDFSNFTFKCAAKTQWKHFTGDFASINAISVEKINGDRPNFREEIRQEWLSYQQILEIKIADKGKQNVIDAIRKLEDFDFVQSATPKYFEI